MKLQVLEKDVRIDKYISNNSTYSRELVTKMINHGNILINGKIVKPSYKTKIDDIIDIDESFKEDTSVVAEPMNLNIVYEDEYIMVINKPSGIVVHPGNGNTHHTLVNGLMYYTNNLSDIGGSDRVGIVHRLDKDTSGLMLVAKTNEAHQILAEDFKNKKVFREYYALLNGVVKENTAFIDAPIGRDKVHFNKMCVQSGGKSARTHLKVLKRYEGNTLVSLVLETGRTHQIRVHMAYIGYPVHNDPVYSNDPATAFGQFLHSKKIRFIHPITKKEMKFEVDLPEEFQNYLDTLEEH